MLKATTRRGFFCEPLQLRCWHHDAVKRMRKVIPRDFYDLVRLVPDDAHDRTRRWPTPATPHAVPDCQRLVGGHGQLLCGTA
jgi:hypothetical protein